MCQIQGFTLCFLGRYFSHNIVVGNIFHPLSYRIQAKMVARQIIIIIIIIIITIITIIIIMVY